MAKFEIAYAITEKHEAGLSLNPKDNGNWTGGKVGVGILVGTKYGISAPVLARYYNRRITASDMKNLPKPVAIAIYRKYYWDINSLDNVIYQDIANKVFDMGVNLGVSFAGKALQKALNALNQNGRYYEDVGVDGTVGTETITALHKHPNPQNIFKAINVIQGSYYLSIGESNESQEAFLNGWFSNRIASIDKPEENYMV